MRNQGKC